MASQGSRRGRFARAIKTRNAFLAEVALREMGNPTLLEALDYLDLLAVVKAPKLEAVATRWHGRSSLKRSRYRSASRSSPSVPWPPSALASVTRSRSSAHSSAEFSRRELGASVESLRRFRVPYGREEPRRSRALDSEPSGPYELLVAPRTFSGLVVYLKSEMLAAEAASYPVTVPQSPPLPGLAASFPDRRKIVFRVTAGT
jgi:hypothetical protein